MKGIELGAINVVLHPHSAEIYEKWIRRIFRLRLQGHVHGNRYGAISQLYKTGEQEGVTLHGVISTFVFFDKSKPWYNEKTSDDATEEDLGDVSLPDHLRPDHKRGNFALDSKRHLLIFESNPKNGGLTPRQMMRLLMQLSKDKKIVADFGLAKITVIPDSKSVDEILESKKLKKILITTSIPNPDFADFAFQDIENWLKSEGAETFRQELSSSSPDLTPSQETKNLAKIASENGFVEASLVDENNRVVKVSTRSAKPLSHTEVYDPKVEAETSAFVRMATYLSGVIARRRSAMGRVLRRTERLSE